MCLSFYIPFTKKTAAKSEVALNYHTVRGLYFLAVVFARTIVTAFRVQDCKNLLYSI